MWHRYSHIPIGGFITQSLIDFPGHIASVIFVKGCNMRCFYCHNPLLVLPELYRQHPNIDIDKIINWIKANAYLLDGVVITGGEPTMYSDLPYLLKILKTFNLKIKLDTNGTNSQLLERLIADRLVDYVAMDIKAPLVFEKYREITGQILTYNNFQNIINSAKILMHEKVAYEFRTTLQASLNEQDIISIIDTIKGDYYLQFATYENKNVIAPEKLKNYQYDVSNILKYAANSGKKIRVLLRN